MLSSSSNPSFFVRPVPSRCATRPTRVLVLPRHSASTPPRLRSPSRFAHPASSLYPAPCPNPSLRPAPSPVTPITRHVRRGRVIPSPCARRPLSRGLLNSHPPGPRHRLLAFRVRLRFPPTAHYIHSYRRSLPRPSLSTSPPPLLHPRIFTNPERPTFDTSAIQRSMRPFSSALAFPSFLFLCPAHSVLPRSHPQPAS